MYMLQLNYIPKGYLLRRPFKNIKLVGNERKASSNLTLT
jgi:hypothetical protein